ncbi:hypothetical protein SNE40_002123 [Patella caerulea]|uniref:Cytosolic fatty-acid binding proteins domain-containing protein n=1 Tax=Patella caerulea TaxID=87958 RepID=A0AAN8PYQ6_PATCE
MAAEAFQGKWNMMESENFDEYMKAVGVGLVMRKLAGAAKPQQDIKVDGDKIQILTSTTFKSTDLSFELGKEFDEVTGDGRNVKSICTLEGNTLKHVSKGDPDTVITREFNGNDMTMTLEAKGVTCTRKYHRAE